MAPAQRRMSGVKSAQAPLIALAVPSIGYGGAEAVKWLSGGSFSSAVIEWIS